MARDPVAASKRVSPVSLKAGATAADRRVVDLALNTAHADPMAAPQQGDKTIGVPTFGANHVHLVMQEGAGAGSIDWELYRWDEASELWTKDEVFGTVTTAAGVEKSRIVEIVGTSHVHLRVATSAGGSKANGWVSGNSY